MDPFSGAQVARALTRAGWRLKRARQGEWMLYEHPAHQHTIPIDPDWPAVYYDDPIFRTLCRDTGLTHNELAELMRDDA
jgi:predicted RNA binding protein YcfA (HicA-like mRNA interferase family)